MEIKESMNTSKTNTDTKGNRKPPVAQEKTVSEGKNDSGLLDRSMYCLDLINGWITSADSKISTSCGIVSVVVSVLVFVLENALSKIDISNGAMEPWKTLFIITGLGAVIAFVSSLFFHFFALSPNFFTGQNKGDHSKKKCNIYYDDIKDYKDADEYISEVRKMSENQFVDDVFLEVYSNAKICSKKMHRFKKGLWIAFVSIVLILNCAMCYFLMYYH